MTRDIHEVVSDIAGWTNPVAELSKRGITGDRNCTTKCPMANYILSQVDPRQVHELSIDAYSIDYRGHGVTAEWHFIDAPDVMTEFIEEFDEGNIPELDNDPIDPSEGLIY